MKYKIIQFVISFLVSASTIAQQGVVSGVLSDDTGSPLIGVNVFINTHKNVEVFTNLEIAVLETEKT